MKIFKKTLSLLSRFSVGNVYLLAVIIVLNGCQVAHPPVQSSDPSSIQQISISALTEFAMDPDQPDRVQLRVLVEPLVVSDSSVPAPCIFRFELYEFHPRSSDPRGNRLLLWPQKDLSRQENAEKHWDELLRGYKFDLPVGFMPTQNKKYVLEVTCISGSKRHSDLHEVQFRP